MEKIKFSYFYKICILLLIMVISIFGTSCKKTVEKYSDIERITYKEILNQKPDVNGKYFVVIYSTTCTYCEKLETKVIEYQNFVLSNKFFGYKYPPVYVLNINATENKEIKAEDSTYDKFIGTSNYEDIKFSTAPAFIEVSDGVVSVLISSKVTDYPVTEVEIYLNKIMNEE